MIVAETKIELPKKVNPKPGLGSVVTKKRTEQLKTKTKSSIITQVECRQILLKQIYPVNSASKFLKKMPKNLQDFFIECIQISINQDDKKSVPAKIGIHLLYSCIIFLVSKDEI